MADSETSRQWPVMKRMSLFRHPRMRMWAFQRPRRRMSTTGSFKNVSVRNGKYIVALLILFCAIYEKIIHIFSKVSNFLFVKYKKIISISFFLSFTDIRIRNLFVADVRFWCRHPRMRMSVTSLVVTPTVHYASSSRRALRIK